MPRTLTRETDPETSMMTFDAVRGVQAGHEFYVAMVSFKTIAEHFKFVDETAPADQRAQRKVKTRRIPEIANYIVQNPNSYIFSSITVSVGGRMVFAPTPGTGDLGRSGALSIYMDSPLLINDGQHRCTAIRQVVEEHKHFQNEKISVVFFADKGLKRSQQMFTDLNKHAVKPTKSLNLLYDHRDLFARFIVTLSHDVAVFRGRTEVEKTSISNRSTNVFTLNGIADATKYLLKLKTKSISAEKQSLAVEYWHVVSENIPEWQLLLDGDKISPADLRRDYVHSHTNMLNALGFAGYVLINKFPDRWKSMLKNLQNVPWGRDDPIWEGKIVLKGRMLKNRAVIKEAADVLLEYCGAGTTVDAFDAEARRK